jgi:hypothetical protein
MSFGFSVRIAVPVLLGMACAPQNAEITGGTYTAFLSLNTSGVFVGDQVDIDQFDNSWIIDCRAQDIRHPEALSELCDEEAGRVANPWEASRSQHESWINRDGYLAVHEELAPWRGEAVMTSEGDFQLTFHHDLPGNDFRFAIAVDPKFAPSECRQDESGAVSLQPIDGDWIGGWTRGVSEPNFEGGEVQFVGNTDPGGTMIPLNANSYQFNPDLTTTSWVLPQKMEAGYARARWGPEEMFMQASRFAEPVAYANFELDSDTGPPLGLLYVLHPGIGGRAIDVEDYQGDDYEEKLRASTPFRNLMNRVELVAQQVEQEMDFLHAGRGVNESYRPFVPSNAWRRPDAYYSGLDRWGEMHTSWIRFDQERDQIARGEDVTGEFRLWFFGANSQSRLLVEGRFEAKGIKRDTWVTRDVMAEKMEENGTGVCGEPTSSE